MALRVARGAAEGVQPLPLGRQLQEIGVRRGADLVELLERLPMARLHRTGPDPVVADCLGLRRARVGTHRDPRVEELRATHHQVAAEIAPPGVAEKEEPFSSEAP
jgi:hypothetical protein